MASNKRSKKTAPPAKTLEGREGQLVALATNLAEEQLRAGTATSQVITHYLKLGTTRERLEQEKLHRENTLLEAKAEQVAAAKRVEELYEQALMAMKSYSGQEGEEYYDE